MKRKESKYMLNLGLFLESIEIVDTKSSIILEALTGTLVEGKCRSKGRFSEMWKPEGLRLNCSCSIMKPLFGMRNKRAIFYNENKLYSIFQYHP
jgi:hypothetical protein